MPVGECFWSRGVIKSCQRIRFLIIYVWYGALAQLGERYTGSVEVVGSSPIGSISATHFLKSNAVCLCAKKMEGPAVAIEPSIFANPEPC